MKFIQLITLFSMYILCFFALGSNALIVDPKNKGSTGKQGTSTSSSTTQAVTSSGSGSHSGNLSALGLNSDGEPVDAVQAFEELKTLTSELTRKHALHKQITIGSAITNAVLLLLITGLIGFGFKEKAVPSGEPGEKDSKKPEGGNPNPPSNPSFE